MRVKLFVLQKLERRSEKSTEAANLGDVNTEAPEDDDTDILLEDYLETDTKGDSDPEVEEEEECKDAKVMSITQDVGCLYVQHSKVISSVVMYVQHVCQQVSYEGHTESHEQQFFVK